MATWQGLRQAQRNFHALEGAAIQMFRRRLREEAEEIATDVEASRPGKGIPRDKGILAGTIRAEGPFNDGRSRYKAFVSAGGTAAPYALRQHEDLQLRHELGEARYFIRAAERRAAGGTASKALGEQLRSLKGVA